MIEQMPHCDQSILHAPGECRFCDQHPDWQEYREAARISFTGHRDSGKAPCPSEHFRPGAVRDRWPGNRPYSAGVSVTHFGEPWPAPQAPAPNMISRVGNRLRSARHRWAKDQG